jgi:uncharacterized protein YcnI
VTVGFCRIATPRIAPVPGILICKRGGHQNMNAKPPMRRRWLVALVAAGAGLCLPAAASAHAEISPRVSLSGKLQLYSLAVPTEKTGLTTTKIVMTVPGGFGIDSFVPPPPGWIQQVQQSGSGNSAVITKVTWTGGKTPTGEDSLFQFLAQPASSSAYTFQVQQTYSDGSIVNWAGPESSDAPAPTIEAKSSLGGGGVSVLTIIALIVGLLGLGAGGAALVTGSSGKQRPLA